MATAGGILNDYEDNIKEDTVSNVMKVWLARFILKRGKGARNVFYMNGGGKRWTVDGVEQVEPGYKISKIHKAYVLDMKIRRKCQHRTVRVVGAVEF